MRKAVGKILKMKKKDANWKKQKSNKSEGDESGKSSGDSNGNCSAAKVRHIYIYYGKDRFKWSKNEPTTNVQTSAHNLVYLPSVH